MKLWVFYHKKDPIARIYRSNKDLGGILASNISFILALVFFSLGMFSRHVLSLDKLILYFLSWNFSSSFSCLRQTDCNSLFSAFYFRSGSSASKPASLVFVHGFLNFLLSFFSVPRHSLTPFKNRLANSLI